MSTTADIARQLVVFALGDEEYALPITRVQEIIRYSEPRAVASEAAWIKGVISLRGKIIPVCDLASRLNIVAGGHDEAKIVIVETVNGTAGVIVDQVEEVLTVEAEQIDEVPGAGKEFIEAIVKIGDRLVILLDADGIFTDLELAA